jgi:streptogramin lyase
MQENWYASQWVRILLAALLCAVLVQGVHAGETYRFVTKWGSWGSDNGQFMYPIDLTVDKAGFVYVADYLNNRIQKFTPDGALVTKWGSLGTGDGQFNWTGGVAVDDQGYVYIADTNNNRIQKFTSDGQFVTKWGSYGSGDGQFMGVEGVAVDSSGNVYVVDVGNDRIQKFTPDGRFILKWGSEGYNNTQFITPVKVAVDSGGYVYVVEWSGSHADWYKKFTSDGTFVIKVGSPASGEGKFEGLISICIDKNDNIYLIDYGNSRILKFSPAGTFLTVWGEWGTADGQFAWPQDVAVDASGNVYVLEGIGQGGVYSNRVQKFAPVQPLSVTGITPASAQDTGQVSITDLSGSGFSSTVSVKLTKPGSLAITATGVTVVSQTKITCTFDLNGKDAGKWDVVVTNPDGSSATLPEGFTITMYVHPVPSNGTILFESSPRGADIYIDGVWKDTTPATVANLVPGTYVIKMTLAGYPDYYTQVLLNAGDLTKVYHNFPEDQLTGTIEVSSSPTGAEIYLDGSFKGTTTKVLNQVSSGYHSVRVSKSGYSDYGTDLYITAGKTYTIFADMKPLGASVLASSSPAGAEVYFDGILKGITPLVISDVRPGYHTMTFNKKCYKEEGRSISIAPGEMKDISVSLTESSLVPGVCLGLEPLVPVAAIGALMVLWRRRR